MWNKSNRESKFDVEQTVLVKKLGPDFTMRRTNPDDELRLIGRHTNIGKYDHDKRLKCQICKKNTSTKCIDCDVPLHAIECFHVYHTAKDLPKKRSNSSV